jgi:uncharacterized protein DUF4157
MCPARYAERLDESAADKAPQESAPTRPQSLVVGAADDHAERDADKVASEVIARLQGGAGAMHQHAPGCGHGEVRRAADSAGAAGSAEVGLAGGELSSGLSARIEGKRGSGSALPTGVRQRLESGFGGSLSDVRIHTDGEAASLNRAVAARAFTTGKDIFFGAGEFRPDTAEGEQVLAHEVAHTRQGGSRAQRTAIRRWDLKSKKPLQIGAATDVTTLESRPIWFVEDKDGDRIVVKTEDQPVGLGLLASIAHKKLQNVKSVEQRQLTKMERLGMDNLIEIKSMNDELGPSWTKRGNYVKQEKPEAYGTQEPLDAAKADALANVNDRRKSLVAMTVAEGDSAEDMAKSEDDVQTGGKTSKFRKLLSDRNHVKLLGKMTATDLFLGNTDRVANANLGNWFYNPQGVITLIDHVDPGKHPEEAMTKGYTDPNKWDENIAATYLQGNVKDYQIRMIGNTLITGAKRSGDETIAAWADAPAGAGPDTRRKVIKEDFFEGAMEGFRHIAKVFATTKWSIFSLKAHSAKTAIRSQARKSGATDGGTDYYAELKRRATWIRTNVL